jgi:hypothetical protein
MAKTNTPRPALRPTVQFLLRMDPELREALRQVAEEEHRGMSEIVIAGIEKELAARGRWVRKEGDGE